MKKINNNSSIIKLIKVYTISFFSDFKYYLKSKRINLTWKEKELMENWIIIIPDFLNEKKCEEIKNLIDKLCENNKNNIPINNTKTLIKVRDSYDWKERYDTWMIDIFNIDNSINEIKKVKDKQFKEIVPLIEKSIWEKIESLNFNSYINKSITNTRVHHVDTLWKIQFKIFVYLTDVLNTDYWPYCYVKKTHSFSLIKYKNLFINLIKWFPITDMRIFNKDNHLIWIAKKWTLIISNQNWFHWWCPQKKWYERMILVHNLHVKK